MTYSTYVIYGAFAFTFVNFMAMFFVLIRNGWVHNSRIKAIGTPLYNRLPSYSYMMKRFWVWDVNKFYKEPWK